MEQREVFQEACRRVGMGLRAMGTGTVSYMMLKRKAEVFREYAAHHRREAEAGSDNIRATRLKKAEANERHAEEMEAIIRYVETGDASGLCWDQAQPG